MTATNPTMRLHFTPLYFDNRITPNDINNDDDNSEATKGSADVDCQVDTKQGKQTSKASKQANRRLMNQSAITITSSHKTTTTTQQPPNNNITMKLSISMTVLAAFAASGVANGFSVSMPSARASTMLSAQAVNDAASMIENAMALSKKHGAASVEARLAWEAIEEIQASDNTEATKGSADVDCQVDGDSSELCKEYDEKMEALQSIMKQIKPELDNVQALATELRNVKIGAPESKPKPQSPELMAAIESAQAVSQEKGESSVEARLAWETVEEVASAPRTENAMGGMLTDECLVETAADACAALEELNRALEVTDSNKE
eukprot:CAMPEP_0198133090 /NCGR_PEP_ID=MMETSP1442-20131203/59385_1 /TAXON_ID= /ORGANISM="Craspedostauros australis, Strain CCMP3328" /LENGTH=319 /DNA_ID=CAMNT_0043794195 /DNA_START=520 /DNA_END=1480 /DNA_ORIENTATION=-